MDKTSKKAALEAILFAMGESVKLSKLAETIETDEGICEGLLDELAEEYKKDKHGIELIKLEDSYQFVTKATHYDTLIKIAKTPKRMNLSDSVIETLSIIAYKQPVTRLEVEGIRGVSCDHAIDKLLEEAKAKVAASNEYAAKADVEKPLGDEPVAGIEAEDTVLLEVDKFENPEKEIIIIEENVQGAN